MNNYSKKDLAIVGISGKFPKSENIDEFWQNLVDGNALIHSYTDEELISLGVEKHTLQDENFVKVTSQMDGSESFDYSFFGYSQSEAKVMDPQARVMHEQVWLALEDANLAKSASKNIGLYLSASDNPEWRSYALLNKNEKVNPLMKAKLSNKNNMSTLISYSLNLKGPSYYIDTESSSSLVAIHLACRSLLMRECAVAVAGGVSIKSRNGYGYHYLEGMFYSKDGSCKTFDASSSGTVPAEGVGAIVIKRLENAIEDNDRIYAVIKSSAVNNDGNRKIGYIAPSVQGQYECIRMAHKIAGVKPSAISYVEAHGTGTVVGDPIEMKALNKAFASQEDHQCPIGSVKTNMGHLDRASGVAGVIKTTLALKNKMIPASLNFEMANPEIDFDSGPFFVNTALRKWDKPQTGLRHAGVSSFGFGGTNAHIVLSEFEQEKKSESSSRPYQLLTYSAKSSSALNKYEEKLKSCLQEIETEHLPNIAFTQNTGREDFKYRKFIVADTKSAGVDRLHENKLKEPIETERSRKNMVFMFPGQGSQYYKMAFDIYQQEACFKEIMDRGFELLQQETGTDYKAILGYSDLETSNEELINQTQYTQPLLFLVEYALSKLLMKWGITPNTMIGHSLGEYVAACISGVFSFEDALRIVSKRGKLMGALEKGSMVAIGASVTDIKDLLVDGLSVAAVNTSDSCVVSGEPNKIEALVEKLSAKGVQSSQLKTSHAFHSAMMDEMLVSFEDELSNISFSEPSIPFISNLTGKVIQVSEATSKKYWLAHLRQTVNFSEGLKTILKKDTSIFTEVGPGKTLSVFLNQQEKKGVAVALLKRVKEVANDNETLTNGIGRLWSLGAQINWETYYEEETRTKVALPTYAFDTSNLPVKADPIDKFPVLMDDKKRKLSEWFYEPIWKNKNVHFASSTAESQKNFLIFTNDEELTIAFRNQLEEQAHTVVSVRQGRAFRELSKNSFELNPDKDEDYKALFEALQTATISLDHIVCFLGNPQAESNGVNGQSAFFQVLDIAKNLHEYGLEDAVKLTLVTHNLYEVTGAEQISTFGALAVGLIPVISQEYPLIKTQCIDVLSEETQQQKAGVIYREITSENQEKIVAFRNKKRWVKSYDEIEVDSEQLKSSRLKENGVYLITGGLGNLGFIYAKYLLEKYNASLLVVGRSSFNEGGEGLTQSKITKQSRLQELESLGNVLYLQADVADLNAMKQVIAQGEKAYGEIQGIIHAAGLIDGASINKIGALTRESCENQFRAKVGGVIVLEELFERRNLDFCVLISSHSSMVGGETLAAYAAANTYMDVFVQTSSLQNCFCVNYDRLNYVGISNDYSISKEEAVEVFEYVLHFENSTQIIVSIKDVHNKIKKWMNPLKEENASAEKVNVERSALSAAFAPPETANEIKLIALFQEFFGFSNMGIHDNFFELGIDSLKGVILKNQMHKEFGIEVSLVDLFEFNTVQKLTNMFEVRQADIQVEEAENTIII